MLNMNGNNNSKKEKKLKAYRKDQSDTKVK